MSNCVATVASPQNRSLPEISVDGVLLDKSLYAQELQYHHARDFVSAGQKAGQALVIKQLLINELEKDRTGGDPVSDEEDGIQALLEKNVTCKEPSEEDCRRYFDDNPDRFRSQRLLQVEHILLAAPRGVVGEREQARAQALSIIGQVIADPALFPALAEQYSGCPSKSSGGLLGEIGKGQSVPEFEEQIMRLPVGLAEFPVESRYGFHVVRLKKIIPGEPLEYEMIAEKIKGYLTQKALQISIHAYIQSLVERANITGIGMGSSDGNILR